MQVPVGRRPPPLLHGNPLTHVSWHRIAPMLADTFTVICPDLRGQGDSSRPDGGPDPAADSFRAMGEDFFDLRDHFGHDRLAVAGPDRGARVAFRMVPDRADRVTRMAGLDILPPTTC